MPRCTEKHLFLALPLSRESHYPFLPFVAPSRKLAACHSRVHISRSSYFQFSYCDIRIACPSRRPLRTLFIGDPSKKITPFSRLVLATNFELSPLDAIQVEICRGVDSPLPVRAEYGLKILIVIESERRALRLYWIKVRQREGFILHLLECLF